MRRLLSLVLMAVLAVPTVGVAQSPEPSPDTPSPSVPPGPQRYLCITVVTDAAGAISPAILVAGIIGGTITVVEVRPDCGEPVPSIAPSPSASPTQEPTPRPTRKPRPTPRPSYKKLSKRSWQRLVRSPDDHLGERIQLWACIFQFDSATGKDSMLAYSSNRKLGRYDWWSDGENSRLTGPASRLDPFVEGDLIWMNATVGGSYSYDTQAGGNTTVPEFYVQNVRRKGSCD